MTTTPSTTSPTPDAPAFVGESGNGLAIASLILGVLSVTGFMLLTGIPAIITGIMSLRKGQKERGMSIAGIVMGSIGTVLSLLGILLMILFFMYAANEPSFMQNTPATDTSMPVESSQT